MAVKLEENPLVSICCTTYNHEKYIGKAMEGFIMQETDFPYEILIGEDCSTDNTRKVIEDFMTKHPDRIRLFANEKNMGGRKNAQNIRAHARGRYLAICEGDDYWVDSSKLQRQIKVMEKNPDLSLCFHSAKVVTAQGLPLGTRFRPFTESGICPVNDLIRLAGGGVPTQSKVCRRPDLADMPEWHKKAHVGDMATDLLLATKGKAYYIDKPMSVYRLGARGSWTRKLYSGPDLIEKKVNMLKKDISLYQAFDEYTNHQHRATIDYINNNIRYGIEYLSNPFYATSQELRRLSGILPSNRKRSMLIKFSVIKAYAIFQKFLNIFK